MQFLLFYKDPNMCTLLNYFLRLTSYVKYCQKSDQLYTYNYQFTGSKRIEKHAKKYSGNPINILVLGNSRTRDLVSSKNKLQT